MDNNLMLLTTRRNISIPGGSRI